MARPSKERAASPPTSRPTTPPPAEAIDAWTVVEPEAMALAEHEVETPRVDLQVAGETAQRVVTDVNTDPPLRARFNKLVDIEELPKGVLTHISLLANAGWYARHQQSLAEATSSTAQVPAPVLKQAIEVHGRMEKIGLHFHGDDAREGPIVRRASIRRSYRELANGLVTFADYYQREHDTVSKDPKWYRATDEAAARTLATAIRTALSSSETPEHALWTDRSARVYTLLLREYGGVQSFGGALLRATPAEAARRFPSLIAESRAAPAPREKKPTDPDAPVPTSTVHAPKTKRAGRKRRR